MRQPSSNLHLRGILVFLAFAISLCLAGTGGRLARAQSAAQKPSATPATVIHMDDQQRSYRLDHYKLLAESRAPRGENIYFFKCWMCPNKYAKTGPTSRTTIS